MSTRRKNLQGDLSRRSAKAPPDRTCADGPRRGLAPSPGARERMARLMASLRREGTASALVIRFREAARTHRASPTPSTWPAHPVLAAAKTGRRCPFDGAAQPTRHCGARFESVAPKGRLRQGGSRDQDRNRNLFLSCRVKPWSGRGFRQGARSRRWNGSSKPCDLPSVRTRA